MATLKPIDFKFANRKLYAPSGEGSCSKIPLPVFTDEVQCVSCWKCSFLDRLKILFSGARLGEHYERQHPASDVDSG